MGTHGNGCCGTPQRQPQLGWERVCVCVRARCALQMCTHVKYVYNIEITAHVLYVHVHTCIQTHEHTCPSHHKSRLAFTCAMFMLYTRVFIVFPYAYCIQTRQYSPPPLPLRVCPAAGLEGNFDVALAASVFSVLQVISKWRATVRT